MQIRFFCSEDVLCHQQGCEKIRQKEQRTRHQLQWFLAPPLQSNAIEGMFEVFLSPPLSLLLSCRWNLKRDWFIEVLLLAAFVQRVKS